MSAFKDSIMEGLNNLPIRAGHTIERNQVSDNAKVHYGDRYNFTYHAQETGSPSSIHKRFLDSLWFNTIDERRERIKWPAPTTLEWVFEHEVAPASEGSVDRPEWDNFVKWASHDNSTYWICGKAGSGKSTLMSHLVRDKRTIELLRKWSPARELQILSFFFWRPGTDLQKKVTGMLRSLLCQICNHEPSLIDGVIADRDPRGIGLAVWTEESLSELVVKAIACSQDSYCIFIDGLDEYIGPYDHLVDLIGSIQGFDNVKCCVASRPETELSSKLSTCKQLRLEHLNHADISKYTSRKLLPLLNVPALYLHPHAQMGRICNEIVDRASGVFLWAALAIPPILKGAHSGDDLELLIDRLNSLPSELADIFGHMVRNIDHRHQTSLAFYLHVMKLQSDEGVMRLAFRYRPRSFPRITDIVAAHLTAGTCNSYATFAQLCDLEVTKIVAQSAGLLEVRATYERLPKNFGAPTTFAHDIPDLIEGRADVDEIFLNPLIAVKARRSHTGQDFCSELVRHENLSISWVHRSAHDFVFPTDGSPSPLQCLLNGHIAARRKLWRGALRFLSFGASGTSRFCHEDHLTGLRIMRLARSAHIGLQTDHDGATQLLGTLRNVVTELDPLEAHCIRESFSPVHGLGRIPGVVFWETAVHAELWGLLEHLIGDLKSETGGNELLIPLLNRILRHYLESSAMPSHLRSVLFLMKSLLAMIHSNIKRMLSHSLTAIREMGFYWYGAAGDFKVNNHSHHGHPSVSGKIYSISLASQAVEALKLAETFWIWNHLLREPAEDCLSRANGSGDDSSGDALSQSAEVTEMLHQVMDTIDAHFELEIWRHDDRLVGYSEWHRRGIVIHMSHKLALALKLYDMDLPEAIRNQLHADLRIICLPTPPAALYWRIAEGPMYGQAKSFIWFQPSRDISIQLLSSFRELEKLGEHDVDCHARLKRPALLLEWTELLMGDVAINQPQMSVVQQTLALACIRTYLPQLRGVKGNSI